MCFVLLLVLSSRGSPLVNDAGWCWVMLDDECVVFLHMVSHGVGSASPGLFLGRW